MPLALTEKNARRIVELAGRSDVPVHAGCVRPMVRPLRTAEHVHGRTGLDGYALPEPTMPLAEKHGVDFIVDTVMAAPEGEITLCTLGPLTNVAMALVRAAGDRQARRPDRHDGRRLFRGRQHHADG